jgi:hypothetical protein
MRRITQTRHHSENAGVHFPWNRTEHDRPGCCVPLFETVTDLTAGADPLRRRRYGVIEAVDGQFRQVVLRPWPKIVSVPGILLIGGWQHERRAGDRVRLFYNQPRRFPNFLVLKYIGSTHGATVGTVTRALAVLDEVARLKGSDALLCDVANGRITTKLMDRWGWEPHCPSWFHRHYIKRFYGVYPSPPPWISSAEVTAGR